MKKLLLIPLSFCLFFAFRVDDDLVKKIITSLEKYNFYNPQEKVYLHLDKPYYTAGESVWFKAYAVDANNLPDTLSVPLYVDLIDNQLGRIIDKRTLKLQKGASFGDFQLPDSLHAGFYRIRAYTNWMRNFSEEQFFTKDFKVYEVGKEDVPLKINARKIDVQFFPEGGNLVEGLESRVGFKAIDAAGKGLDISGAVLTESGDTAAVFESQHLGMGFFNFKPEANQKYIAKIKYREIYQEKVQLPAVQQEGYVMGVDVVNFKDNIRVFVANNRKDATGEIAVIAQCRGRACYAAKAAANKKAFLVNIPRNKFPDGIVQFTIFDEKLTPRAERVAFINSVKSLTINILADKKQYKTREKVNVEIDVKDAENKPVKGNFSLVVSDAKQVLEKPFEENILSYLLLSSDIKGNIEQPNFYFDKSNVEAYKKLDILMMTQGWRRFNWHDVFSEKYKYPAFLVERGLSISGEVHRQNGKNFEKPISLTLMLTAQDSVKQTQIMMGQAAVDGNFLFYGLDFKDSTRVLLQAVAGRGNRNTKIFINSLNFPKVEVVKIPFNPVEFDTKDLEDYLKRVKAELELEKRLRLEKVQLLNAIMVKAKRHEDEENDNRVIYAGTADASVKIDDKMVGYTSIFDVLRGRVAGVQVGTGDGFNPPNVIIRGIGSLSGSTAPLYLLDGVPTTADAINSTPVSIVDRIDVLKGASAAIYGSSGGNGVISVLTKRGNKDYDWSKDNADGITVFSRMGYNSEREFYAPKYNEDRPEFVRPDYRSTVYWNPVVKTDENGKAKISFFNTDAETEVRISMEGLSNSGIPAAAKTSYFVKKN